MRREHAQRRSSAGGGRRRARDPPVSGQLRDDVGVAGEPTNARLSQARSPKLAVAASSRDAGSISARGQGRKAREGKRVEVDEARANFRSSSPRASRSTVQHTRNSAETITHSHVRSRRLDRLSLTRSPSSRVQGTVRDVWCLYVESRTTCRWRATLASVARLGGRAKSAS